MRPELDGTAWRMGRVRSVAQSAAVVAAMVALLAAVGALFGGPLLVVVLLALAIPFLGLGPSMGSRVLLRMQGAVPLSRYAAPRIDDLLTWLARRAGLATVPQLYLLPTSAVTAFTTGTRESAAIAVTDGLLRTLAFRELAGVLAHEVSHIRRNDVWMMSLANLIARATRFMSGVGQILLILNLPLVFLGGFTMPWNAILLLVFAPTVSVLLQLALSRTHEYQADADAVRLTGDPHGLASALSRLERVNAGLLGRLMPGPRDDRVTSWLRTHPSTQDRIDRLARLATVGGRAVA